MSSVPITVGTEELTEAERKQAAQLEYIWREPNGFLGWFKAVHHTTIGVRYVVTAFCFFLIAGLLAGAMRLQLAFPESHFLSADKFAVPMMFEALSVYLVPLMVGTRNIAFPRLNAFSYYLYLFGGIMFYIAFFLQHGRQQRLVFLRSSRRSRLRTGQARRFLGAAHHFHRGLRPRRRC
jgi:cytochrome c oxidase subunit 1